MPAAPGSKIPSLSVFFPALNDSGTIASMVIRAVQAASKLTPDFEVIVVNDGSTDATPAIADELARTYPNVRVVHHPSNRGYGGALQTGFSTATKELVFYTDGDAQYDPGELAALWSKMTPAVDLVNGYKISRADPLHRIIIGRIYHHTVRLLFGSTTASTRSPTPGAASPSSTKCMSTVSAPSGRTRPTTLGSSSGSPATSTYTTVSASSVPSGPTTVSGSSLEKQRSQKIRVGQYT